MLHEASSGSAFLSGSPKLAQSLDVSFAAVVLKGRQNYLCKTRLDWLIEDADKLLAPFEAEALIPALILAELDQDRRF